MVPFQMLTMVGHTVHAVCPGKQAGETVRTAFPPPEVRERPATETGGPLEGVRHQPDGEIPLAPHFSVTFSAPMVAVTSHGELAREAAPVRLSPEPPGEWRWVGTRTVLFEPLDPGADPAPLRALATVQAVNRANGAYEVSLVEGADPSAVMADLVSAMPAARVDQRPSTYCSTS